MEALPEECLSHIISFTLPQDACRSAAVSPAFRDAADVDSVWESFLPSDYQDIISRRSVSPVVDFSSKKDLFRTLSSAPLLIDGGKLTFSIDKRTNKKCYMVNARELSIAWSRNSKNWSWKSLPNSRFGQVAELKKVCWLEIYGKINVREVSLSPETRYGAYLRVQATEGAFGLDVVPSETLIQIEGFKNKSRGMVDLKECCCVGKEKEEGWLEVELGEFYNSRDLKEVKMWFREIKGAHLKGGLLVQGILLRPK